MVAWVSRPSKPRGSGQSQEREGGGLGVRQKPPFPPDLAVALMPGWRHVWERRSHRLHLDTAGRLGWLPGGSVSLRESRPHWPLLSPQLTFQAIINSDNRLEAHPIPCLQAESQRASGLGVGQRP